jgi:N-acetyltransferase
VTCDDITEERREVLDLQPTLCGDLLSLRPLESDDFKDLYEIASDPALWEQHPSKNRTQQPVFEGWFDQAMNSGGALVATDRANDLVIGTSRYDHYDPEHREVEIGWTFLARSHWGGEYNHEMKRLMLEHAFHFVDRVVFVIDPANYRSQRAIEKLGAIRTGMRPDASGRPSYVFQITAREWSERRPIP